MGHLQSALQGLWRGKKAYVAHPAVYAVNKTLLAPIHKVLLNPINKRRRQGQRNRKLEIGPGPRPVPGFETLNVVTGPGVTYVGDASRLAFPDGTFSVVYASHIIEHIPWYQVEGALVEWARVLATGGRLEVWTPNGFKIAKAFVEAEETGSTEFHQDGWWRFNNDKDPCRWMSGRMFSYGDGSGGNHPNWHRSLFSPRYLMHLFESVGLVDVHEMDRSRVRGNDHGWINLGVRGTKR
jgi:SAM-dependent methyltransferase